MFIRNSINTYNKEEEVIHKNLVKTVGFFGFNKRYLLLTRNKLVVFESQDKYTFGKDPKVSNFNK